MRTKTKKVYYCDYCNKHSLRPLLKHEKHCTSNIHRDCRVCTQKLDYESIINKLKDRYEIVEEPIKLMGKEFRSIEKLKWFSEPITSDEILKLVDGCPACALTIIKNLQHSNRMDLDFDYNKEMNSWWKELEYNY